jgi:hypothetical protein
VAGIDPKQTSRRKHQISANKTDGVPWKRLSIEASAIVASILLAFAIDAWWEDLAQYDDEIESIELIRRDLESSIELLESHASFSESASQSALNAYAALSGAGPYDRETIHHDMLRVDRLSLKIPTAAYTDLLSTGNLRVIQDRSLRDAIIRFYESAELIELVVEKNNDVFLDRQLIGVYFGQGLILPHARQDLGTDFLNRQAKIIAQRLGEDFVHQPDPIWDYERDSQQWQILRSLLLNAANIHVVGELLAEDTIVEATSLLERVEEWQGAK